MDFVDEFTPLDQRFTLDEVMERMNSMKGYITESCVCPKGDEIEYILAVLDGCEPVLKELLSDDYPVYIDNLTCDDGLIVDLAFLCVLVACSYNVDIWWTPEKGFYIRE
jgi:hypothetical protein